jgi:ABC-type transport system involved in multi-copper enzyme maturation permease subunit
MNLRKPTVDHIRLISLYWSRYAVRSGSGLVYLLIALAFGLFVANMLMTPVEQLMARQEREMGHVDPQIVRETIIDIGRPVIQWVLGQKSLKEIIQQSQMPRRPVTKNSGGMGMTKQGQKSDAGLDPWTSFLLEERPALLSAIFLVLLFGMPFVISFLAYNQVSGDIQSHGLRYLLLRTERSNIYFGRFLGTVIFSTAVMAIIVATIVFYLGMKTRIYPALALVGWGAHGFLALALLMVPYIAVCSLISASVDSPFLSLILAKLTIAGVLLLAVLGSVAWKPAKYLLYALPWAWQGNLLHPAPAHCVGAALACLVYTAVFLMLGYYRFETRDL